MVRISICASDRENPSRRSGIFRIGPTRSCTTQPPWPIMRARHSYSAGGRINPSGSTRRNLCWFDLATKPRVYQGYLISYILRVSNLTTLKRIPLDPCTTPGKPNWGRTGRSVQDRSAGGILIMTPYKAQVTLVKKLQHPHTIESKIQTVGASQGSEVEVVIVLMTRNLGSADCLQSTERTNMILSRARIV